MHKVLDRRKCAWRGEKSQSKLEAATIVTCMSVPENNYNSTLEICAFYTLGLSAT